VNHIIAPSGKPYESEATSFGISFRTPAVSRNVERATNKTSFDHKRIDWVCVLKASTALAR
jgi:hypothetical protein